MRTDRVRYFATHMDTLSRRDRVFINNPVIMQGLGLAPLVIAAVNVKNAFMLAVAVALLLTPTRMVATYLARGRSFVVRSIVYAVTAGALYIFVSYAVDMLFGLQTMAVGIYLPLLVMEPLILKRYESPKPERVSTSFKKGVITTLGYCLVLFLVGGLRELLATGMLGGIVVFRGSLLPLAAMPAGGFILLGFLAALWRACVNTFKKKISMEVRKLQ